MSKATMTKATETARRHVRASWRHLLVSLLRLTSRVQDGLERRVRSPSGR